MFNEISWGSRDLWAILHNEVFRVSLSPSPCHTELFRQFALRLFFCVGMMLRLRLLYVTNIWPRCSSNSLFCSYLNDKHVRRGFMSLRCKVWWYGAVKLQNYIFAKIDLQPLISRQILTYDQKLAPPVTSTFWTQSVALLLSSATLFLKQAGGSRINPAPAPRPLLVQRSYEMPSMGEG